MCKPPGHMEFRFIDDSPAIVRKLETQGETLIVTLDPSPHRPFRSTLSMRWPFRVLRRWAARIIYWNRP